ncbi:MAG: nuclear transport factor 2 family protein [Nitrososphaeraceae archaeon]
MNSHYNDNNLRIVSDYFHLINEKDMQGLLNLFADDCVIYEPLGKGTLLHNDLREKIQLKGKSEIESFFNIVMMASDGFQYQIEFIDEPINMDYNQPSDIFDSTSSSIVSVLATFYRNKEGHGLKEWLTFHVVSRKNYDSANTQDNDYSNNNKEIKTLWIQFSLYRA